MSLTRDPASFRDPDGHVLHAEDGRVLRALGERGAADYRAVKATGLLEELEAKELLVRTWETDGGGPDAAALVVEARRVPFVSYPYEWSFSMLRDAALLTLEVTERAYRKGVAVKDATAYNVLFDGPRPVFVDVGSFEPYRPGTPWPAYGQFGDHFLAPLLIEARTGMPFQRLLRAHLDGLPISSLRGLLGWSRTFRPGTLVHVGLRAMLDRGARGLQTDERRDARQLSVDRAAVLRTLAGLRRTVAGLRSTAGSDWASYEQANTYEARDAAAKEEFVARAATTFPGRLAWDVGANTARYSRVLARSFETVVAMDADPGAVEAAYHALRREQVGNVLPLVIDATDPSPGQGWRGVERRTLLDRGRPDLACYLALVHHLCLGRGIPVEEIVSLVTTSSRAAVVEFVALEDPMGQRVAATRTRLQDGYDLATFRSLLSRHAHIRAEQAIQPTRTLFLVEAG